MSVSFQKIFWWLVTNLPPILTVAFAAYVLLLSQLSQIANDKLLVWILTILGLLGTSELISRLQTLNKLQEGNEKLLNDMESLKDSVKVNASSFFVDGAKEFPIYESIQNAENIDLCGTTLMQVGTQFRGVYEEKLRSGCNLRLLLIDPNSHAVELVGKRNYEAKSSPEALRVYLNVSIDNLRALNSLSDKKGACEIRTLDHAPAIGMIIVNRDKENSEIFVQIFPYKTPHTNRPWFHLREDKETKWYNYFKNQFDLMWRDGNAI